MIRFCQIKKVCVTRKSACFAKNFEKNITWISTVNDVFLYSLNTDNLGCLLTSQVRQGAKKVPDV